MQTSVPVGTAMTTMSHQLDQIQVYQATAAATAPGQTALDGVATLMVSHHSKREA
jgi:hypothetical protein